MNAIMNLSQIIFQTSTILAGIFAAGYLFIYLFFNHRLTLAADVNTGHAGHAYLSQVDFNSNVLKASSNRVTSRERRDLAAIGEYITSVHSSSFPSESEEIFQDRGIIERWLCLLSRVFQDREYDSADRPNSQFFCNANGSRFSRRRNRISG